MKLPIILAGLSLLLAAPAFASDRGPQPSLARRLSQVEHTGTVQGPTTATMPHDHAAMTEHQAKNGSSMCGCPGMHSHT